FERRLLLPDTFFAASRSAQGLRWRRHRLGQASRPVGTGQLLRPCVPAILRSNRECSEAGVRLARARLLLVLHVATPVSKVRCKEGSGGWFLRGLVSDC